MAVLSDTDRARVTRGLQRYWSSLNESLGVLTKSQLRAAVDATDQWIDDNQTSFNNALPTPAKTELTQAQKTLLFCCVAAMRVGVSFARKLIGEVD